PHEVQAFTRIPADPQQRAVPRRREEKAAHLRAAHSFPPQAPRAHRVALPCSARVRSRPIRARSAQPASSALVTGRKFIPARALLLPSSRFPCLPRRCGPVSTITGLVLVLGLLMDVCPARAADWSALPSSPDARFGAAGAALGDRLYVIGGVSNGFTAG